jgi:hypothetical protein
MALFLFQVIICVDIYHSIKHIDIEADSSLTIYLEHGGNDVESVNTKSVTLRVPEHTHRKLRMIAAMRQQTMTDVLIELIEGIKIENQEEISTVKSILYGAAAGTLESENQADIKEPKIESAELKAILKARKAQAKVKI